MPSSNPPPSDGERFDNDLFEAYCTGDDRAFEQIYAKYRGLIYGYLVRHVQKATERDEIFQSIWLKIHRLRHTYRSEFPLKHWIFMISRSALIDHFRKIDRDILDKGTSFRDDLHGASPASDPAVTTESAFFGNMLSQLSSDQRIVLEMRMIAEKSFEEIGKAIGKSPVNARQILSRAISRLRASMQKRKPGDRK